VLQRSVTRCILAAGVLYQAFLHSLAYGVRILTQFSLRSAQIRNVQATLEAVQHLNASADISQLACTTLVYVLGNQNSTAAGAHKALVAAASASV
jgi:hypothetical protein